MADYRCYFFGAPTAVFGASRSIDGAEDFDAMTE